MPAKAGIHPHLHEDKLSFRAVDSRLRGNDNQGVGRNDNQPRRIDFNVLVFMNEIGSNGRFPFTPL